jgi:trigger factor
MLTIEVGRDVFQAACDRVFRSKAGSINVPGFRKGKAPRKIIERLYGEGMFYEDAVNRSYMEAYEAAVAESALDVVGKPDVEMLDITADGYSFTAKVPVKPGVVLGAYKGLTAFKPSVDVTDADVDAEIGNMLRRGSRLETIEETAILGDTVVMDFEGFKDGVAFEGGKGERFSLVLGSGRFIPGFEDQLIGTKAGDDTEVKVTFPEKYQAEELAGQDAVFKVTVHEVKRSILPEADDEFAKDVSEFDTLEELKADIRSKIGERLAKAAEDAFENALLDQVIGAIETDVPEVMIDRQVERMMEDLEYRLSGQRMRLDMYCQMSGKTVEQMKEDMRPDGLRQIKIWLALEAVAAAEGMEITDEDVDAEYAEMAKRFNTAEAKVREQVSDENVRNDIKSNRAVKLIVESATATDQAPETITVEVPKPKKKAPAKKAVPVAEETEAAAEEAPKPKKKAAPKAQKPVE